MLGVAVVGSVRWRVGHELVELLAEFLVSLFDIIDGVDDEFADFLGPGWMVEDRELAQAIALRRYVVLFVFILYVQADGDEIVRAGSGGDAVVLQIALLAKHRDLEWGWCDFAGIIADLINSHLVGR